MNDQRDNIFGGCLEFRFSPESCMLNHHNNIVTFDRLNVKKTKLFNNDL